jgi:ubiquinone/menaquinone biosynthesis C-methylase UbiE
VTFSARRFGRVYDQIAAAYDAVRPGYPPALVNVAVERGGLVPGSPVLEVGPGTGKLTELLVARGLSVDAVDPGPNMIEAARRRLGETDAVTFHVGRFEDVRLPAHAFDAVFSATAFHWVDPDVSWAKAASHLKPGGTARAALLHRCPGRAVGGPRAGLPGRPRRLDRCRRPPDGVRALNRLVMHGIIRSHTVLP